jgi:hypothetical protein
MRPCVNMMLSRRRRVSELNSLGESTTFACGRLFYGIVHHRYTMPDAFCALAGSYGDNWGFLVLDTSTGRCPREAKVANGGAGA